MAKPEHVFIQGLQDRIEEELYKQKITKSEMARRCGFNIKVLIEQRNIHLLYFMRICAELHVSADYLLFGKKG